MNFFTLFQKKSKFFFINLGILGMMNSIWAGALLLMINNKITDTPLPFMEDPSLADKDWIVYVTLIIVSFFIALWFQSYMIKLTYNLGNDLTLAIYDKLRFASYNDYLKLTEEKVRTAERDVRQIQQFPLVFLETFNAAIMVVIGIAYLFWINLWGAIIVVASLVALAFVYIYRNIQIEKDQNEVRELADTYMQNINDFLGGFKEIKMSITRSDNIFFKFISVNRIKAKDITIRFLIRALGNELLGTYAWYVMIGVVLFVLPLFMEIDIAVKTTFMLTLLFLMGPISTVIGVMDDFIGMGIAIKRITEFDEIVSATVDVTKGHGDLTEINKEFSEIEFEDVTFEYLDKENKITFELKPINLKIKKGESIFVTGGNGSGKSTFINLLSGLNIPKSGRMSLNGHTITKDNLSYYRDQLAAIFTDNYLFSENYDDLDLRESNEEFASLLETMKLRKVIKFDDKNNKVFHTLSKGQQKRMALIYSLLENKDILIFDEWAAEQDPEFRKFFYTVMIPDMKRMGKTVIAITHDDAYFGCAERMIKFDYGRIVKDELIKQPELVLNKAQG